MLLRPLVCHRPVMPGRALWRLPSTGPNESADTGSGRGPTSDMSPRSTLSSWGSSSIDSLRIHLPTRVMRGSSCILNSSPSDSLLSARSSTRVSASSTIERNLKMANGRPPWPTRVWRNSTGPRESNLMRAATTSITGASAMAAAPATSRSTARLAGDNREPLNTRPSTITGTPPICSTRRGFIKNSPSGGTIDTRADEPSHASRQADKAWGSAFSATTMSSRTDHRAISSGRSEAETPGDTTLTRPSPSSRCCPILSASVSARSPVPMTRVGRRASPRRWAWARMPAVMARNNEASTARVRAASGAEKRSPGTMAAASSAPTATEPHRRGRPLSTVSPSGRDRRGASSATAMNATIGSIRLHAAAATPTAVRSVTNVTGRPSSSTSLSRSRPRLAQSDRGAAAGATAEGPAKPATCKTSTVAATAKGFDRVVLVPCPPVEFC